MRGLLFLNNTLLEDEETKLSCQPMLLKKKKRHMGIVERGILAILSTVAGSACAGMCCVNNMLT